MYLRSIDNNNKSLLDNLKSSDSEGILDYVDDPFTFIIIAVFDEDDTIIGVGLQRVIEEYKIVMNNSVSNYKKMQAIDGLFGAVRSCIKSNEAIVLLTKDQERFKAILKKHYEFEEREGTFLFLED